MGAMHSWWLWIIVAYGCGSVPFGLLIGRARGVDVRKAGSGNIGATNVGRVLGRKWGALCFALDVIKGGGPVLAAGLVLGWTGAAHLGPRQTWQWLAIAAAAMLGHVFPVWLKFRGGKGVATGLGVMLGLWPALTLPGVAAGLTWLLFASCLRYVSLASIMAALLLPFYVLVEATLRGQGPGATAPLLIVTGLMALLIVLRHRGNLRRLAAGTESRLGSR